MLFIAITFSLMFSLFLFIFESFSLLFNAHSPTFHSSPSFFHSLLRPHSLSLHSSIPHTGLLSGILHHVCSDGSPSHRREHDTAQAQSKNPQTHVSETIRRPHNDLYMHFFSKCLSLYSINLFSFFSFFFFNVIVFIWKNSCSHSPILSWQSRT